MFMRVNLIACVIIYKALPVNELPVTLQERVTLHVSRFSRVLLIFAVPGISAPFNDSRRAEP